MNVHVLLHFREDGATSFVTRLFSIEYHKDELCALIALKDCRFGDRRFKMGGMHFAPNDFLPPRVIEEHFDSFECFVNFFDGVHFLSPEELLKATQKPPS